MCTSNVPVRPMYDLFSYFLLFRRASVESWTSQKGRRRIWATPVSLLEQKIYDGSQCLIWSSPATIFTWRPCFMCVRCFINPRSVKPILIKARIDRECGAWGMAWKARFPKMWKWFYQTSKCYVILSLKHLLVDLLAHNWLQLAISSSHVRDMDGTHPMHKVWWKSIQEVTPIMWEGPKKKIFYK